MILLRTGSSVVDMIVGVHLGLDRVGSDAEVPPPRLPPPPSPLVRRAGLRWKRFVSDSLGQEAAKMHSTLFPVLNRTATLFPTSSHSKTVANPCGGPKDALSRRYERNEHTMVYASPVTRVNYGV